MSTEVPLLDFGSSSSPIQLFNSSSSSTINTTNNVLQCKRIEIQSKIENIDQIKKQLIELRYNTKIIIDESFKLQMKKLIGQLHVLESELCKLRLEEYNEYIKSLQLNEIVEEPVNIHCKLSIAKVDSLTIKTFKYEKKQAMKRWNKALNVISAANQFSRSYENARIKKAEEILQNPITSQMKIEILELRKTLVILNNKKQLSREQEELKCQVVEQLKDLDKRYHEQFV